MRKSVSALITGFILLVTSIVPAFGQTDQAFIRLVNYVSDGPAMDLYLNGIRSDANTVLYGTASDWLSVPTGEAEIVIAPAGGDVADVIVPARTAELTAGSWTTVFVSGAVLRNEVARSIVTENYNAIPEGQALVTVFHGIAGAVPVNFYASGKVQVETLIYPGSAGDNDGADTINLPAGNYTDIQFVRADNGQTLLTLPATALEAGKHYLIGAMGRPEAKIAIGFSATDPQAVVAAASETATATEEPAAATEGFVRVAHFVQDGPSVDVYVDGVLSTGLDYSNVSEWLPLTPGTHQIVLTAAGGDVSSPLFGPISTDVAAGTWTTFYATQVTGQAIKVNALMENADAADAGKVSLSVIHAAAGADVINVYLGEDALLLQGMAYPGSVGDNDGAAAVSVAPATYDISVTTTNNQVPLVDLPATELKVGSSYLIVAYKDAQGLVQAKVFPTVIGE